MVLPINSEDTVDSQEDQPDDTRDFEERSRIYRVNKIPRTEIFQSRDRRDTR